MVNSNSKYRNTFLKFLTLPMHFQWDLYPGSTSYISEHPGWFGDRRWGSTTNCVKNERPKNSSVT